MKWVTYLSPGSTQPRCGIVHGESVCGAKPELSIAISPGSTWFDYELEVAAVIGKAGSDIAVDDAAAHIGGFMLMADWSARDLQMQEMKVGLGPAKSKDGNKFRPVAGDP